MVVSRDSFMRRGSEESIGGGSAMNFIDVDV